MRRFFYATSDESNLTYPQLNSLPIGADIELTESIVHHWCRVLRANIGDRGILFDGFGGEYQVQLKTISKKHATVTLLAHINEDRSASVSTKVGLVMSRGERMDYAIQKSTELGVTAIQLLSSHHGEVNLKPAQVEKKLAHWQQIAIAACEQCGLNRPPLILAPLSITDWLKQLEANPYKPSKTSNTETTVSSIVAMLSQSPYYKVLQQPADLRLQLSVPAEGQPARPESLSTVLKQQTPYIELLVGPEGGLSSDECAQAANVGFKPWQIGTRVLRTETAPVVALVTLHALSH
ncbi:16S rRNA (uracil(1498)-N(3))-methyltransferase [Psychrobacter sp. AOP22-C1-22]|uniref:16S rRNA (uracil(1498)-N(3))-methyltransferase n=1 Tax=unclassified Psychrobacter TaxID=196806 RepID=UPI00178792A9|nr:MULTISPECIES: 16S rRNA (uracil(1498)-N(3))-methyltransferase [unclassified Psychrobacter]MBE0405324.1 16S rRNA (uracil(1498)-N(3))-methyltransferase [Psychrobacter sp. FME6]MBE0444943.1 16S rRNA (uracil(1498)-N(3))-methyltransferase [Psychrobacter sp. FME5]